MTMNKQEFAEAIAGKVGSTNGEAEKFLNAFSDVVISELAQNGKIAWTGFISFEAGQRAARKGRNPQTGATIEIPAAIVPKIKAGKKLKDALNEN